MMYTKKSRFINALSTLTENQKEELKSFFSKYPVYESRINWNSKDLQYTDFSRVFELAENSSKNRKRKTKEIPLSLFTGHECQIISQTKEFIIAIPLNWECAVYFNSFNCGGVGARWCIGDKNRSKHWNRYIENATIFYFLYFINKDAVFGKKIVIEYGINYKGYSLYLATDKRIWSGQDASGLYSCIFRKSKQSKLRKTLWHTILLYERKLNKQLFFEFDIFKKDYIPDAKLKSYENIMQIFAILEKYKYSVNHKSIIPYKKSFAECTVDELFETLRDDYYYKFSSRFSNDRHISLEDLKQFMEIVSFIYDKSIERCKKPSPDYTTGDLFNILFDSFYSEKKFSDSPGTPKLFMEIVTKIYDKWQEEYKKRNIFPRKTKLSC